MRYLQITYFYYNILVINSKYRHNKEIISDSFLLKFNFILLTFFIIFINIFNLNFFCII